MIQELPPQIWRFEDERHLPILHDKALFDAPFLRSRWWHHPDVYPCVQITFTIICQMLVIFCVRCGRCNHRYHYFSCFSWMVGWLFQLHFKCPRSTMSCLAGANLFGQPLWSRCDILVGVVVICLASGTPWKIHMEPTNHLIEEETHLPIFHFWVLC